MAIDLYQSVDEEDVGRAVRSGDLQLAHILQEALFDDAILDRLIEDIEHLGGTKQAGERTAKFAAAMINNAKSN